MQSYQWPIIFVLLTSLGQALGAGESRSFESNLKKALSSLKEQQLEKTRSTIEGLKEQVESDLEPSKRLQASLMLAAHYWESNYRLSRHYLGLAESLRNPAAPELHVYDPEIDHLKIRFRQAALLDAETKRELENQLQNKPAEPLRLSLVEMLLETNDALGLRDDFLDVYRRYYTSYPRTIRKDRFLKTAADIHWSKKDYLAYFKQMEGLLDQYPITDESKAALDRLLDHSRSSLDGAPRYAFTFGMMKKVYRNASQEGEQQKRILDLISTPLRKDTKAPASLLDPIDMLKVYCYLQIYDDALSLAQSLLQKPDSSPKLKAEVQQWIAFIHSERGDHGTALVEFKKPATRLADTMMFEESEAKSFMSSQNFNAAAAQYASLLKRKDHPRYRWYYFWNLLASGRVDNAQKFASRQPDRMFSEKEFKGDAAKYWQGRTLLSAGQIEKAQTTMQELLDRTNPGYYGILAKSALTQSLALASKKQTLEAAVEGASSTSEAEAAASPTAKPILAAFRSGEADKASSRERIDQMPYAKNVFDIAKTMDIDPFLVLSIVRSESAFDSRALSNAGAQGLMQIMPYTAVRLARMLDDKDFRFEQLQSGETNLVYGSLYLALLLNYYQGHAIPAVAAYNAGPHVVNKWLKECRDCPVDAFVEFIPYAETRNYVKKVMSTYTGYRMSETHSLPEFLHQDLPSDFSQQTSIF